MSVQEKREVLAQVAEVQWGKRKFLTALQIPKSTYYRWRAQQLQGKLDIATESSRVEQPATGCLDHRPPKTIGR